MSQVNNLEINVLDVIKFNTLTIIEKQIFEAYRDSLLIIFPTEEGALSFDTLTIQYVERSAFEFVDKLPVEVKNPITIEQILLVVTPLITAASAASTSNTSNIDSSTSSTLP